MTGAAENGDRPTWADADRLARDLRTRPASRRLLLLLARLPLAHLNVLQAVASLHGPASLYRCLETLRERKLVASIQPPLGPGRPQGLFYLTDLGLSVVVSLTSPDVKDLALRHGLSTLHLLRLMPRLPLLLETYDLLSHMARSRQGRAELMAWERPWRRTFHRMTAKSPRTVTLPAGVTLSWQGNAWSYLLLSDLATYPAVQVPVVRRLFALAAATPAPLPVLIVCAKGQGRVDAWNELVEELRRAGNNDLFVLVCDEEQLRADPSHLALRDRRDPIWVGPSAVGSEQPVQRVAAPNRRVPRLVISLDEGELASPSHVSRLARLALETSPMDHTLLAWLARHPFLSWADLAGVIGWSKPYRRRLDRLIGSGLVRVLDPSEVRGDPAEWFHQPLELTAVGLKLAAARLGVTVGQAVRYMGFIGGGPEDPFGKRGQLLGQYFRHTVGADRFFIELIRSARRHPGDALVEWRNAAACARDRVRPDGYGVYLRRGQLYGFFLEYDRGTMSIPKYLRKFGAYYDYRLSGRFRRDYDGFPTILMVTTEYGPEERIAEAAQRAAADRPAPLPVLLTITGRIGNPENPEGPLGPIWREPLNKPDERRSWLLDVGGSPDSASHRRAMPPDRSRDG